MSSILTYNDVVKNKEVIEMTVLRYMAKQRERLIARHTGETFLFGAGGEAVEIEQRTAYDILREIDSMQGLNVKERLAARESVFA